MRRDGRRRGSSARLCNFLVLLLGTPCLAPQARASIIDPSPGQATTILADAASLDQPPGEAHNVVPAGAAGAPAAYPTTGIIDINAPQNSGDPGVLVPLAQAHLSVSHWMEAVEAAGPATPLADPSFEGTVFIPDDAVFELAYRQLKKRDAMDVFANIKPSMLAAQLNSLTVPGSTLRLEQLKPGKVMRTADGGTLRVQGTSAENGAVRLKHSPSALVFEVLEPDLQSGSAVGHIVDSLIPASALTATGQSSAGGPGGRYASVLSILLDPVQKLSGFAKLVDQAGLKSVLTDPDNELTLFAPSNEAMETFLHELSASSRQVLASNDSLADQLVSAHLVSGVALGTKALEALLPDGLLKSQAGSTLFVQQRVGPLSTRRDVVEGGLVRERGQAPDTTLTVDGSIITTPDLLGGKSVVHVLDKVLVPPDAAEQLNVPTTAMLPGLGYLSGRRQSASARPLTVPSTAVQLASFAAAAVALGAMVP